MTEDVHRATEIKLKLGLAKKDFNRKKHLLCGPTRIIKYYVWSTQLYGAKTLTLRREDSSSFCYKSHTSLHIPMVSVFVNYLIYLWHLQFTVGSEC